MSLKSSNKTDTNVYTLEIEIGAEPFKAAVLKAYNKAKGQIALPGFRKGKAPLNVIERFYGKDVFYEDALEIAFPEAVSEAYKEAGIEPVDSPKDVNVKSIGEDGVLFEMKVTVKPDDIKVKAYKGLEAEKAEVSVTPEEVDARIDAMRERNARTITVEDRAAAKGDIAVIDFEGFVDGVAFEGGKGESYPLLLGSGYFIPGFEEQVAGACVNEERDVHVTFPTAYTPELAGKDATFRIKVHEITRRSMPTLDDAFAKAQGFEELSQLRRAVMEQAVAKKQKEAAEQFANDLIAQVLDGMEVQLPDAMVENQLDGLIQELRGHLQSQNVELEQYLEASGASMEELRAHAREQAVSAARFELAMTEIARLEGIDVTDAEVEQKYNELSAQYQLSADLLRQQLPPMRLRHDLKLARAQAVIVDTARRK